MHYSTNDWCIQFQNITYMHLFMHVSYAHKRATSIFIILKNYSYKNRECPRGEHQVGLTDLIHNYMDQKTSWFCHLCRKQKPAWCWFLIRNFTIDSIRVKTMQDGPFRLKRPGLYPETRRIYKHPDQNRNTCWTRNKQTTSTKKAHTKHVSNCVDLLHRN